MARNRADERRLRQSTHFKWPAQQPAFRAGYGRTDWHARAGSTLGQSHTGPCGDGDDRQNPDY